MTALQLACVNGHEEVVRILLAAKATVDTQDKVSSAQQNILLYISLFFNCTVCANQTLGMCTYHCSVKHRCQQVHNIFKLI